MRDGAPVVFPLKDVVFCFAGLQIQQYAILQLPDIQLQAQRFVDWKLDFCLTCKTVHDYYPVEQV